jgi:hypothetical protein
MIPKEFHGENDAFFFNARALCWVPSLEQGIASSLGHEPALVLGAEGVLIWDHRTSQVGNSLRGVRVRVFSLELMISKCLGS